MLVKTLLASAALITSTWVGSGYAQPPGGVMPELDIDDDDSIRRVASTLAYDMMSEYSGNLSGGVPGLLPGPPPTPAIINAGYFWWEAGAMFGSLLDYWYYTGDDSYNDVIYQAILHQVGEKRDFMPQNQSAGMGNDDQGFWAMTAMTAAEFGFQDPPADQPQWLALAQAVFNTQAPKIDDACGGGLRWQAYTYLSGYDYKNSISNGCFFNVGARLAMYTKNDTYAQYAEQIWDWMESVNFIDDQFNVYDGAGVPSNCTDRNPYQFSYNAGIFMFGAAVMYQYTEEQKWADRVTKIVDQTIKVFFPEQDGGILTEVACEYGLTCTIDMYAQKAFITRWMAATSKVAPFTYDTIMDALRKSAPAAVAQCSGGDTGRRCGLSWRLKDQWDGTQGVGQQMGVLEVVQSLLIKDARPPVANDTGGTSGGDPLAGTNPIRWEEDRIIIGTKDRAGAAIITILLGGGIAAMCAFMTFGK